MPATPVGIRIAHAHSGRAANEPARAPDAVDNPAAAPHTASMTSASANHRLPVRETCASTPAVPCASRYMAKMKAAPSATSGIRFNPKLRR